MEHLHTGPSGKLPSSIHPPHVYECLLCLLAFILSFKPRKNVGSQKTNWCKCRFKSDLIFFPGSLSPEEIVLEVSCKSQGSSLTSLIFNAQGYTNSILPRLLPLLCMYLERGFQMELAICWLAIWTNLSDIIYRRSAFKWAGWYSHPSHCSSGLQGLPVDCHSHDSWQARSLVGINQLYSCLLLLRVSLDIFSTAWFMPQLICFTLMVLLACLAKILKHC